MKNKMNVKEIAFLINEKERIVLKSEDPLDEISCCYDGTISLIQEAQTTLLTSDDIMESMRVFALMLKKALDNSLLLDVSLSSDIGFIYNEYNRFFWSEEELSLSDTFMYEQGDKNKNWIGMQYLLWLGRNNATWLYNDQNGEIILEITPCFPYLHTDPSEEQNYIPYEEWIKNYRSYVKIVISKMIAQEWLRQANEIVEQIERTIDRWGRKEEIA